MGKFLLRTKEECRACKWQTFPGFWGIKRKEVLFSAGALGLEASDQPDLFRIPFSAASRGENAMKDLSPASHPLSPLPTRNTYV